MDKYSGQKSAVQYLYPPVEPFDRQMMDVGDGHSIYVEQSGNPEGRPSSCCMAGPGGGCSPAMRRYFSPKAYRIIFSISAAAAARGRMPASRPTRHGTWWPISSISAALGLG